MSDKIFVLGQGDFFVYTVKIQMNRGILFDSRFNNNFFVIGVLSYVGQMSGLFY